MPPEILELTQEVANEWDSFVEGLRVFAFKSVALLVLFTVSFILGWTERP